MITSRQGRTIYRSSSFRVAHEETTFDNQAFQREVTTMTTKAMIFGALLSLAPLAVLAGAGPQITFQTQVHDFGDVIHGQSPSAEVTFTNTGDELLVVEKIMSSCGCAKAVRGSQRVTPGESSKIYAQIITYGMSPGRHTQAVDIHSNDPAHPVTTLKFSFNVVRHVTVDPLFLARRLSAAEKEPVFRLTATNHWTEPITLKAAKSDDPCEALLTPQEIVVPPGGKASFELAVRVKRATPQSYVKGSAYIETSDPLERMLRLRYYIQLPKAGGNS